MESLKVGMGFMYRKWGIYSPQTYGKESPKIANAIKLAKRNKTRNLTTIHLNGMGHSPECKLIHPNGLDSG